MSIKVELAAGSNLLETGQTDRMENGTDATAGSPGTGSQVSPANSKDVEIGQQDPEKDAAAPGKEPGATKRSKKKIALTMTALALAVFLAALDVIIVATAIPTITEEFNAASAYTWIGSAYLLSTAASVTIWGKLSDIFGRKPLLLIANVVFFVGSVVAATSQSIAQLLTGRAIQGSGGGGLVVLSNIVIGDLFSQRERGTYYGVTGAVWRLPIPSDRLLAVHSLKTLVGVPFDALAFVLLILFLDLKTPRTLLVAGLMAIDWLGCLFMVAGTLLFLLGLTFGGQTFPWGSATVVCLIVFGIVSFGLFFLNEWKLAKYAVVPMRVFNYGSTIACLVVCFCHGMVFIAGSYYLPFFFQTVLGASPILSGVYLLPFAMALAVFTATTGHFIRKTGKPLIPIFFGFTLMTLGFGLYVDLNRTSGWAKIIIYQLIAGTGVGPLFQSPLIAMQSFVKPGDLAAATSTFAWARMLAAATSLVIGEVIFQNAMGPHQPALFTALGSATAAQLTGNNAGANTRIVDALPGQLRTVAQDAFADSLHFMWIFYLGISTVGLFAALWIGKKKLEEKHVETNTGLIEEETKRTEAAAEAEKRKTARIGRAEEGKAG